MRRPTFSEKRSDGYFAKLDYTLLVPVLLMTIIGLVVMQQVLQTGYGSGTYPGNFIKQLAAVIMGLLLAIFITLMEAPTIRLLSWLVYGISVFLLIYEKIDGYSLKGLTGADSWLNLPLVGSFQPSELAKTGIAMVAAQYFSSLRQEHSRAWLTFAKIAAVYAVPLGLILLEPDFGTSLVILFMFAVSLFLWGIRWRYVFGILLMGLLAIPVLWFAFFSDYMKNRILLLLFPGQDLAASYNLDQAIRAITSGGLFGNRTGIDVPVPIKESDFIFSGIAEQLGFLGTSVLILLIAVFLLRVLRLAFLTEEMDPAASFLTIALFASLTFHFIENIGMNVGLLPITGIPLPFISNGGTSMVVNFFALGLILNASMEYANYKS